MKSLSLYSGLVSTQLRSSLMQALQYRADFFVDLLVELVSSFSALVPLLVVFHTRPSAAGVSFEFSLYVMGFFLLAQSLLDGWIQPSLLTLIDHIRKGSLDYILLRPVDAQWFVSTSRIVPVRFLNLLTGIGVIAFASSRSGTAPTFAGVALGALVFTCGVAIIYSVMLIAVSVSFYVVKIDNLSHILTALFDTARWPTRIFHGSFRFFLTFIFPVIVVTTLPADALRGVLSLRTLAFAVLGTLGFLFVSRAVFRHSLSRYASASS